jgi:hypothetical protein
MSPIFNAIALPSLTTGQLEQLRDELHRSLYQPKLSAHDRAALLAALARIEAELNKRYASPAPSP